jgi:hypothetical protein
MPGVSDGLAVMLVGKGREIEIERKKERKNDKVSEREEGRGSP